MQDRIARAKKLLKTVQHAAMATVNQDGSPHNTPYFFAHSPNLAQLYWRSSPETQHSQNIARTGRVFVVLYHAAGEGSGLYITAHNARLAEGNELDQAIAAFNAARQAANKLIVQEAIYKTGHPKFYVADTTGFWVNGADFDVNGVVSRDYRVPITAADLA